MTFEIRQYRPEDSNFVRTIAFETADHGQSMKPRFDDLDFIADSLVSYYIEFEPESLFVAADGAKIIGYLTGCVDTKNYAKIYSKEISPRIFKQILSKGYWLKPAFWKFFVVGFLAAVKQIRIRKKIAGLYPAHCHMNLLNNYRRMGIGEDLMNHFLEYLREKKIKGVHLATASEEGKSFFQKMNFEPLRKFHISDTLFTRSGTLWVMGRSV